MINDFFYKWKYEILLFALVQHLFIGIFLRDLPFYTKVIWPINMLVLGAASACIYNKTGKWRNATRYLLFLVVLALPIGLPFFGNDLPYILFLNAAYMVYFLFIFWEILRFMVKPGYINKDVISASACGYLLLIEVSTFLLQYFFYQDQTSFKGVDATGTATVYADLVYFSSITLTSIGFGDITPAKHYTKLVTSLFGIAGQFYTVVLVGILISKFSSNNEGDGERKA